MRGSAPCRDCVTAFSGLRPLGLEGAGAPSEHLWPAFQLAPRVPKPTEHTRPRGIHAPTRSVGITQTMLFALANIGLERMGREKPQQPGSLLAACCRNNFSCSFSSSFSFAVSLW